MTDSDVASILVSIAKRLRYLVSHDEHLRNEVRRLADSLLEPAKPEERVGAQPSENGHPIAPRQNGMIEDAVVEVRRLPEPPEPSAAESADTGIEQSDVKAHHDAPVPSIAESPIYVTEGARTEPPNDARRPRRTPWYPDSDDDLTLIEQRCRLKARGSYWAAKRTRLRSEGANHLADIAPTDREVLDEAARLQCYLWMNRAHFPIPSDLAHLDDLGGCFEAVAEAIAGMRSLEGGEALFEPALALLAEAQSALRAAVEQVDGPADDDQNAVFHWLRRTTTESRVFIQRNMKRDDPADPRRWRDLLARIKSLAAQVEGVRDRKRQRQKLLSKLRYMGSRLAAETNGDDHWPRIAEVVDELVQSGLPPSDLGIREILLPHFDDVPPLDRPPIGFVRFLEETERVRGNGSVAEIEEVPAEISEAVKEVARLLEGKTIALIGGDCRPRPKKALEAAFRLKELLWVDSRHGRSVNTFEPAVARPDVAVVLLAIRWSSHSFGDVKQFCDHYGKPLVRLAGGYGVNQVAAQILAQGSERLHAGI